MAQNRHPPWVSGPNAGPLMMSQQRRNTTHQNYSKERYIMFAVIINGTIYAIGLTPEEATDELTTIVGGELPTIYNIVDYSLNPNLKAYVLPCREELYRALKAYEQPPWHITKDEDGWPVLDLRGAS